MNPDRERVKDLLDRFRQRAPEEVRSLARQAGDSATEAWREHWRPWEGLGSPAGRALLVGGAVLFLAGWATGRYMRVRTSAPLAAAAAVAGGVAAGLLIGAQRRPPAEDTDSGDV